MKTTIVVMCLLATACGSVPEVTFAEPVDVAADAGQDADASPTVFDDAGHGPPCPPKCK